MKGSQVATDARALAENVIGKGAQSQHLGHTWQRLQYASPSGNFLEPW